jgi:hypothetical protein
MGLHTVAIEDPFIYVDLLIHSVSYLRIDPRISQPPAPLLVFITVDDWYRTNVKSVYRL